MMKCTIRNIKTDELEKVKRVRGVRVLEDTMVLTYEDLEKDLLIVKMVDLTKNEVNILTN